MPSFTFRRGALGDASGLGVELAPRELFAWGRIGFALALTFVEAAG